MTHRYTDNDVADLVRGLQADMAKIGRAHRERGQLTGTATSRDKRVTVTVNVSGALVDITFAESVGDLTYGKLAKLITSTAQEAAAEVARKSEELLAPLRAERARRPKLHELIDGLPDFTSGIPEPPPVPTTPPLSQERQDDDDEPRPRNRHGRVTDTSW